MDVKWTSEQKKRVIDLKNRDIKISFGRIAVIRKFDGDEKKKRSA